LEHDKPKSNVLRAIHLCQIWFLSHKQGLDDWIMDSVVDVGLLRMPTKVEFLDEIISLNFTHEFYIPKSFRTKIVKKTVQSTETYYSDTER